MTAEQCPLLDRTILHDCYFQWNDNSNRLGSAQCRWGWSPYATIRATRMREFGANLAQDTLDLVAAAPIAPGDEVTIDYHCPLWFAPQD